MKRLNSRRGWTLAEMMVVLGLAAVVMLVVSQTLISTSRITRSQSQTSMRQANLQTVVRHLEAALRSSLVAGIRWKRSTSPNVAMLAAHCTQSGCITTTPKFQAAWRCFLWNAASGQFFMGESVATSGYPAPSQSRPQAMPEAQMDAILATGLPAVGALFHGRLICDRVSKLEYSLKEGPLFEIKLEMDVPTDDRAGRPLALERLAATILIHPRNRI